jgi:hypothetical protein
MTTGPSKPKVRAPVLAGCRPTAPASRRTPDAWRGRAPLRRRRPSGRAAARPYLTAAFGVRQLAAAFFSGWYGLPSRGRQRPSTVRERRRPRPIWASGFRAPGGSGNRVPATESLRHATRQRRRAGARQTLHEVGRRCAGAAPPAAPQRGPATRQRWECGRLLPLFSPVGSAYQAVVGSDHLPSGSTCVLARFGPRAFRAPGGSGNRVPATESLRHAARQRRRAGARQTLHEVGRRCAGAAPPAAPQRGPTTRQCPGVRSLAAAFSVRPGPLRI